MKDDAQLSSTIEFIEKFNDLFDILNIKAPQQGLYSNNKFKMPLSSPDDWRFEASMNWSISNALFGCHHSAYRKV